jgi:hypothetical protein
VGAAGAERHSMDASCHEICRGEVTTAETFRTCLLRVISADLGEERMAEYAEKARELFPQFARSEEGGEA